MNPLSESGLKFHVIWHQYWRRVGVMTLLVSSVSGISHTYLNTDNIKYSMTETCRQKTQLPGKHYKQISKQNDSIGLDMHRWRHIVYQALKWIPLVFQKKWRGRSRHRTRTWME